MKILLKTLAFSLSLTLVFTLVTYLLPQVEGEAPVETQLDLSNISMDDFIAFGEDLFNNKGTCALCHKPPPLGRAPDIQGLDMQQISSERLADSRYQGKATDTASYLLESMLDPSIYVVAGWGKKGSDGQESPMPPADKPPLELRPSELNAIIAYLQAKDGNEVTVSLPSTDDAMVAEPADPETGRQTASIQAAPVSASTAEEALRKYACTACHAMNSNDALVGPALVDLGARMPAEDIRKSIIDPNADIAEGFPPAMPADFAEKMTVKELDLIVQFLAEKK